MIPFSDIRLRNRVRERRVELGLGQGELAARSGVSRRVVGLVEREDEGHVPSGTVQLKLAAALGSTVQELFWSEPAAPEPVEAVAS